MSTKDPAAHTPQDDVDIRSLYRANRGRVDVEGFVSSLDGRLAGTDKRARRRPAVRRIAIALAVLVLAAGMGVGAWQAAVHLDPQREAILVIDDPVEPATSSGGTKTSLDFEHPFDPFKHTAPFQLEISRSLSELDLSGIWEQAAAVLGVDPARARLSHLDLCWDAEGLIVQLFLQAATPDGGALSLSNTPFFPEGGSLALEGTLCRDSETYVYDVLPLLDPALTIEQVLAGIDSVGLDQIVERSGGRLSDESAFDPSCIGVEGVEVAEHNGVWELATTGPFESAVADGTTSLEAVTQYVGEYGSYLRVKDGAIESVAGLEGLVGSDSPLQGFVLCEAWAWKAVQQPPPEADSYELTTGGIQQAGGPPAAYVLIAGGAPSERTGVTVAARPVDAGLDGFAFIGDYARPCRVANGAVEEIASEACRAPVGVSYSLDHDWLVYGPLEPYVPCETCAVSIDDLDLVRQLPPYECSNSIVNMRYDARADQVWFAYYEGPYTLATSSAQRSELLDAFLMPDSMPGYSGDAADEPAKIPLNHDCRGDFAISSDASTIVYLGSWENPLRAYLWTAGGETEIAHELATLDSPVFSPDGSRICFVGSTDPTGDTSLWIYDLQAGEWTELESTRGLTPTFPAFSRDGARIAFRNWMLGDVWAVTVDGGELTRYDLSVAEAPIAW
ncbi:MAG: hypothetical protein JXA87_05395 [Thermoleophilia bacterium]|nr:hypothetical protein [Thermoleophilia bacterium]